MRVYEEGMASHNEKEFSVKKPKVRRVANKQISFRVNEAEYEKLQQSAKNLNMSVPAFVKKKAQGAKLVRPVVEQEIALEISRNLKVLGNNANQIARRLNSGTSSDNEELNAEVQRVLKGLGEIWRLLNSEIQNKRQER
ncbi:plasmid mobilization protein [Enterococcus faecium]|jgi:hypothetical protein|uniref:plasmid mobilization protein n=3 Tax=Enterococcus faecium TaxID=1352 RepID=UPI0007642BE6|nr:plasmid mobilization relaxosome protein MobC [Enterococcus faecium]KWY10884.1 hypothetical protein AS227_15905 [Enterococcus faecium]KWY10888.1 hypothetical protein AS227_15925 [Enterococcus faecium]TAP46284.1 plasmid mobilization relaxosome protein MobC [Enterococcus faecium]TAQ29374.1 plasmid mobilization relaxosome protein MobC [Enterococcus faecium]BDP75768.1 mobilization protein [Enterococcus faecium]